jgi:hypothetical protein
MNELFKYQERKQMWNISKMEKFQYQVAHNSVALKVCITKDSNHSNNNSVAVVC